MLFHNLSELPVFALIAAQAAVSALCGGGVLLCVGVYGPRLIAAVWLGLDLRSRLLTYIRLPEAARYIVVASPDGLAVASSSMVSRHRRSPCRSTHQIHQAIAVTSSPSPVSVLQCSGRIATVTRRVGLQPKSDLTQTPVRVKAVACIAHLHRRA